MSQRWDLLEITASSGFRILIRASSVHPSVRLSVRPAAAERGAPACPDPDPSSEAALLLFHAANFLGCETRGVGRDSRAAGEFRYNPGVFQ